MNAVVILNSENCHGEYAMFELRSLDKEGAELSGPLLLEVGENVELRVEKGSKSIQLRAQVHAVASDRGTMKVRFADTGPALASFLAGE